MKRLVTALLLALYAGVGPAGAIAKLTSTRMSCQAIQAAVVQAGAAIVGHQSTRVPGLPIYDRYVRNRLFCSGEEVTETKFVPALDTPYCPLYRCVPIEFEDFNRR